MNGVKRKEMGRTGVMYIEVFSIVPLKSIQSSTLLRSENPFLSLQCRSKDLDTLSHQILKNHFKRAFRRDRCRKRQKIGVFHSFVLYNKEAFWIIV